MSQGSTSFSSNAYDIVSTGPESNDTSIRPFELEILLPTENDRLSGRGVLLSYHCFCFIN